MEEVTSAEVDSRHKEQLAKLFRETQAFKTGEFSPCAIPCNLSANCVIVMFWQVNIREPGGEPAGAMAFLQEVRLAGSAFLIFGFAATSEYAVTGRVSVW